MSTTSCDVKITVMPVRRFHTERSFGILYTCRGSKIFQTRVDT